MIAFEKFPEIFALGNVVEQHKAWLEDYKGNFYSIGENGVDKIRWKEDRKFYDKFDPAINKISRKKDRLVIEFDDKLLNGDKDKVKIQKHIKAVKKQLESNKWGYIESTHKGASNYIWVEFTRELTSKEAEEFLKLIAPRGSEIDLNFTRDTFCFPVMFAIHWKHSNERELPINWFAGEKIDYDKLGLEITPTKKTLTKNNEGEEYATYHKPAFNYEDKKPDRDITDIKQLQIIIEKNFPSIWFETQACLSACATLSLKNLNGCPSLNLIGNPSGEKTTTLSFFYGQAKTYISDDFTPRAFVSHSANVGEEELENVDLLPKLKDNVLITPELAPLFEAPKDKMIDNFAMLTRVLDGEGLNRDSGTHGHRGYTGDYKFVWLGASTPLRASVWNIMGKIGNRLFFLNMREKNRSNNDFLEMFRGRAYEEKVKECRGAVKNFLDNLYKKNGIRNLEWDAEGDILLLPEIIKYAKFLSKLRASLMTWKSEDREHYEYNFPIIEEPPRAINSLYNFAKGNALINGRNFLKKEDLEIVKAICYSSMPYDRSQFLKLLAKHEGKLTTRQIERELNCSSDTALRTMKTFEVLGVVSIKSIEVESSGTGRPMNYIEIMPEFEDLLDYTQVLNREVNPKPQQDKYESDAYCNVNPADFVKKQELSHPTTSEVYTKPQEINPVCDTK